MLRASGVSLGAALLMLLRGGLVRRWLRNGSIADQGLAGPGWYANAHLAGAAILATSSVVLLGLWVAQ